MPVTNKPSWTDYKKSKSYPSYNGHATMDVAIIGGGLAGIFQAYLLAKAGKKVAVLEKQEIGSGATGMTTAFLTSDIDTDASDLISMYGLGKAKLIRQSHQQGIDLIEKIITKENIKCEFMRCDAIRYATSKGEAKGMEEEIKSLRKLGFNAKITKPSTLPFPNYGSIHLASQGKFHPLKFLYALAAKAAQSGTNIYEQSAVKKISGSGPYEITTTDGTLTAKDIIIATYDPLGNPKVTLFKKGMYESFVMEVEVPKKMFDPAIHWSLENPYHYFRIDRMGGQYDRMIMGGADYRSELHLDPKKSFRDVEEHLKLVMGNKPYRITRKWFGPILEPTDGLALIGAVGSNRYVATAFSGNGMTYSAIAARLNVDLILKKKNALKSIYDPKRIPSLYQLYKKGVDYTEEFFGGAVKDLFK